MESTKANLLSNPRKGANLFSVLFFGWTIPIFKKGYGKQLNSNDVYEPLDEDRSNDLGNRLQKNWLIEYKTKDKPSLMRVIAKTFWYELIVTGTLFGIYYCLERLVLPFVLESLLSYFREGSKTSYESAMKNGTFLFILSATVGLLFLHSSYNSLHYGMRVQVGVCSIIYRKALRLSQKSLSETAPGKLTNLLSNDVDRLNVITAVHQLWTAPLTAIISGYFLWRETQWAGMIGIAIVILVAPLQSYAGKLSSIYRFQTALRTDERVRFMDEIIAGVQVIKFYAWEEPFAKLIAMARQSELKAILRNAYVRAFYMTFNIFTTRMAVFCTVSSIILFYGRENISVSKIFLISYFLMQISYAMCTSFVRSISEAAEALVALKRLQTFLEYEEKNIDKHITIDSDELKSQNLAVQLENVSAVWAYANSDIGKNKKINKKVGTYKDKVQRNGIESQSMALQQINMKINEGKLIGIIGEVGSGKSSLMQVILGELPINSGSIGLNGSISYASQEPWNFGATIRQNITFGLSMDKLRYDAAIECTALQKDLEQFDSGDLTIVGDRGVSLSGGQKARINLARAVYRKADIYLLDDPLSAVDAHVGLHLYNECIGSNGLLARQQATRILVTHQVHFLKDADWIFVLREGRIETHGTYQDILNSGIDFASILSSSDENKGQDEDIPDNSVPLSSKISDEDIANVTNKKSDKENESIKQLEITPKGKIDGSLLLNYLRSADRTLTLIFLISSFLLTQILASGADMFFPYWARKEEVRNIYSDANATVINFIALNQTDFVESMPVIWETETYVYIYAAIMLSLFLVALARSIIMYRFCASASRNLHDNMFKNLISTTMRFFDLNPSGHIMNRFSKDMGGADEALPKAIFDAAQTNLNMIGSILVTVLVNPKFGAVIVLLFILFIFLRKIYLKSSTNIKRFEAKTKSPVFTHIASTFYGLSTIRAARAEEILQNELDDHQDLNTATLFMFLGTSYGFAASLDLMVYIFVGCVIYTFLLLDFDASGDRVGLAITQSLSLASFLQWGVRLSADVINQLIAVERILEYNHLEPEKHPKIIEEIPIDWPSQGKIEFKNVFCRYFQEAEPVLRDLTFLLEPKEKIGIVGRTGAGKSSLIGSLFRLALIDGDILIDDVNTAHIELKLLRSRISIIPQDPVLFSGTLRKNLDPFNEHSDDEIWKSIENVELKEICNAAREGLEMRVMANGSNFSVGQRQLLCLARAILRKNQILVLDEATANVDLRTDQMIQQTIREKFSDCTVLTVAHRLQTIIDSDRVLVMDAGVVVEFDKPYKLLQNSDGIFHEMVKTLGSQEYNRLFETAKMKCENNLS